MVVGGKCTGPPMAPRRTASAFLAAVRASSVRGLPVASMEACIIVVSAFYGLLYIGFDWDVHRPAGGPGG